MRDRDAIKLINQTREDLETITQLWTLALRHHHDHTGTGYPASSTNAGNSHGTSDPVGTTITNRANRGWPPDHLGLERADAEDRLRHLAINAAELVNFVRRYTTPPATGQALEGCRLCAPYGFTVVYAKGLCDWHWRFHREHGTDAHSELTRMHHDGRRITQTHIAHYHGKANT